MDFFGFMNPDSSAVGSLIKAATDGLLLSPDWGKNMDICDLIETGSVKEVGSQAVRSLSRRLAESDPNVVSLALTVAETCMKNCSVKFASAIDKGFMDEMANIARGNKGRKNSDEALRLIQSWSKSYESQRHVLPIFFDTYSLLKSKGIRFPPEKAMKQEHSDNTNQGIVTKSSSGSSLSGQNENLLDQFEKTNKSEFDKLTSDLSDVMSNVKVCRELMLQAPSQAIDDAIAEVIGFLEACKERMMDLIEAGSHGLLGEELFGMCLQVNDVVIKTIAAYEAGIPIDVNEDLELRPSLKSEATMRGSSSSVQAKATPQAKIGAVVVDEDDDDDLISLAVAAKATPTKNSSVVSGSGGPSPYTFKRTPPPPPASIASANSVLVSSSSSANTDLLDFSVDDTPSATGGGSVLPVDSGLPKESPHAASIIDDLDFLDISLSPSAKSSSPSPQMATSEKNSSVQEATKDFDAFLQSLDKNH